MNSALNAREREGHINSIHITDLFVIVDKQSLVEVSVVRGSSGYNNDGTDCVLGAVADLLYGEGQAYVAMHFLIIFHVLPLFKTLFHV